MGKPINPIRQVSLKIGISLSKPQSMVALAKNVVAHLTANVAFFAIPSPALVDITSAATDVSNAIKIAGYKRNRGSKANYINLRAKTIALRDILTACAAYCTQTIYIAYPNTSGAEFSQQAASTGFSLNSPRKIANGAPGITGMRILNNSKNNPGTGILRWKKPKAVGKGVKVRGYSLSCSTLFGTQPIFVTSCRHACPTNIPGKHTVVITPILTKGTMIPSTGTILI